MRYRLIDEEKSHHPISRICRALGVTRAGYHAWRKRPKSRHALEDAHLKELIEKAFADSHSTYGAPRIHAELVLGHGVHTSRKRVARLMRELDIIGVSRRRAKGARRNLAPETPAAPDLVKRDFSATGPNELWMADITYVPTWEGWLFLAVVCDVFTKRIVGWSMRDDLSSDIVVDALGMAATLQRPGPGLVHHSDRGGQYRSLALGRTLRETGIMASMGSRGDAYDNAEAESVMSTIKNEYVKRHRFKTRSEARLGLFSFIQGFYNPHRRHSSLGLPQPDGVREDVGGGRRDGGFRSKLRCQRKRGNPNPTHVHRNGWSSEEVACEARGARISSMQLSAVTLPLPARWSRCTRRACTGPRASSVGRDVVEQTLQCLSVSHLQRGRLEMVDSSPFGLPAFGSLLPRKRLLGAIDAGRPSLVLIEAPAGYGKTSLAIQIATAERFEACIWFEGSGLHCNQRGLLQALVWRSRLTGSATCGSQESLADASLSSLEHEFTSAISSHWRESTCLVLDDVCIADEAAAVKSLENLLRSSVGGDCCVVIASRQRLPCDAGGRTWYVEADDLRFSSEEAAAYARAHGVAECEIPMAAAIHAETAGHPALFAVMLRSFAIRGAQGPSGHGRQVEEQLLSLAAQLDAEGCVALRASALLGSGTSAQLGAILGVEDAEHRLRGLASQIPLLKLSRVGKPSSFHMHDIGRGAFGGGTFAVPEDEWLVPKCLESLEQARNFSRLFGLLVELASPDEIALPLEVHGECLLESGALELLAQTLERLPREVLIARPALLLLEARLDKIRGENTDSRQKARIAKDLAEHEAQDAVAVEARQLLARLLMDQGRSRDARAVLEEPLNRTFSSGNREKTSLFCHCAAASANLADSTACTSYLSAANDGLCEGKPSTRIAALVNSSTAYCQCVLWGEYGGALRSLAATRELADLDVDRRLRNLLNAAGAHTYRGQLVQARQLMDDAERLIEVSGARDAIPQLLSSRSMTCAASADYAGAEKAGEQLLGMEGLATLDACDQLVSRACWRRIVGDARGSLADAEQARDLLSTAEILPLAWQADLEVGAALLALGDAVAAREIAEEVLDEAAAARAKRQWLSAAMIVEEAARQAGQSCGGPLSNVVDYIGSGDGNWQIAMYARAFPSLLALVARATGCERIPPHLLQLLALDGVCAALEPCKALLSRRELGVLTNRTGENPSGLGDDVQRGVCRVRVFGGLVVRTSEGEVSDSAWKKRKARLMFAMLVVRKGKDVPRDQLLEYLWPEMDADRARANFYVVWNNMKRALSPNLDKGKPCPYARASGGVCRVDDLLVVTDLDDFEQRLVDLRKADAAGDTTELLRIAGLLVEIYRGDLLPGDIYDDWFAPLRERCRQEFGDAMLRAGVVHVAGDDHASALRMIRAALAHDPWREDLYQAALRSQIASGQRGAAIETYMACMHKLSEDLGIDPSAETRRLYDQVLSMEDGPIGKGGYSG